MKWGLIYFYLTYGYGRIFWCEQVIGGFVLVFNSTIGSLYGHEKNSFLCPRIHISSELSLVAGLNK